MLSDRGFDIGAEEQIIKAYEDVDAMHSQIEHRDKSTEEILKIFYDFAAQMYPPNGERRDLYPNMYVDQERFNIYGSLSNIYKLKPTTTDSKYKRALVWYIGPSNGISSKASKLVGDDAKTLIKYWTFDDEYVSGHKSISAGDRKTIPLGHKPLLDEEVPIDLIITITDVAWPATLYPFFSNLFSNSQPENAIHLQFFRYSELTYNPTKHSMTFPHRKLTPAEVKRLVTVEGVSRDDLPCLLYVDALFKHSKPEDQINVVTDPIAKWYDFTPGDIIEITRINYESDSIVPVTKYLRAVKSNTESR
jgi:DNA-directed RNA polymerase subunit H (RpoH/RPB5)